MKKPRRKENTTRQELLKAGIEVFAQFGPDEVGIRRLAGAAGANSAALSYYFGGKDGYYRAVLRYLTQEVMGSLQHLAAAARAEMEASSSPRRAREVLRRFVRGFIEVVLSKPQAEAVAVIVWRELLRPSYGFPILYERVIRPVHELLTELVARATRRAPEDPAAVLLAHSLWGQAAIFRIGFHVLRRRLGLRGRGLSRQWVARITETVDFVTDCLLLCREGERGRAARRPRTGSSHQARKT